MNRDLEATGNSVVTVFPRLSSTSLLQIPHFVTYTAYSNEVTTQRVQEKQCFAPDNPDANHEPGKYDFGQMLWPAELQRKPGTR